MPPGEFSVSNLKTTRDVTWTPVTTVMIGSFRNDYKVSSVAMAIAVPLVIDARDSEHQFEE